MSETKKSLNILRISDVAEIYGVSRVTVWRMEKRGELPPRRKFNDRYVGWIESEFRDHVESAPYADEEAEAHRQSELKTA